MAQVRSSDGSQLTVTPVPVLDRDGAAYELTLSLLLDDEPFGQVGERCGWFLAEAADRLRESDWPVSTLEAGAQSWARDQGLDPRVVWEQLGRYLPRDRELFAFLARDPNDLTTSGELRAWLRADRRFVAGADGSRGCWHVQRQVVLDAWGRSGTGVRAVLTTGDALALLDAVLAEAGHTEGGRAGAQPPSVVGVRPTGPRRGRSPGRRPH